MSQSKDNEDFFDMMSRFGRNIGNAAHANSSTGNVDFTIGDIFGGDVGSANHRRDVEQGKLKGIVIDPYTYDGK